MIGQESLAISFRHGNEIFVPGERRSHRWLSADERDLSATHSLPRDRHRGLTGGHRVVDAWVP